MKSPENNGVTKSLRKWVGIKNYTMLQHVTTEHRMSTARQLGKCEERKLAAHWKALIKAARYTVSPSQHLLIADAKKNTMLPVHV